MPDLHLKANGKTLWQLAVSDLLSVNQYHETLRKGGVGFDAGMITLDFTNPASKRLSEEDFGHLGTADLNSLTLEIDMPASITGSPKIETFAEIVPIPAPLGDIRILRTHSVTGNSSLVQWAEHPVDNLFLQGLHVKEGSAVIDSIKMKLGNRIVFDRVKDVIALQNKQAGKANQSGYVHAYPNLRERVAEAIALKGQPFMVEFNYSTPGNVTLVSEYYQRGV